MPWADMDEQRGRKVHRKTACSQTGVRLLLDNLTPPRLYHIKDCDTSTSSLPKMTSFGLHMVSS